MLKRPDDAEDVVQEAFARLAASPGAIEKCGAAGHQAPHDRPEAIAEAITAWALRHCLLSR